MKGSLSVRSWPEQLVIVRCETCRREGRYARAGLAARFGWEAAMPDVLAAINAACERGGAGIMDRCRRAVFIDPRTDAPWRR